MVILPAETATSVGVLSGERRRAAPATVAQAATEELGKSMSEQVRVAQREIKAMEKARERDQRRIEE